jgi:hypothetical protein
MRKPPRPIIEFKTSVDEPAVNARPAQSEDAGRMSAGYRVTLPSSCRARPADAARAKLRGTTLTGSQVGGRVLAERKGFEPLIRL